MLTEDPPVRTSRLPEWVSLGVILLVALGFRTWSLDQNGFGNLYYSAAVRSMLASPSNFFFGSFDRAGIVTVDKPPVALWIQAAGAGILGYNGLSLLLPQALMGVISIGLTYHLVRRSFGAGAALLAALALALTPICVAVDRDNLPDPALILVVLLATWALTRAAETGRLSLLLLATGLIGLGFNIKMLAAFVVLPTFYIAYFLAAPMGWRARLAHLSAATVVLVVVSLSWSVVVEMTPKDKRPYIGGSRSNSALELAVGYNGIARIVGMGGPGMPGGRGFPGGLPKSARAPVEKDQDATKGEDTAAPAPPPGFPPFPPGGPGGPGGRFMGGMPGFGGTPGFLRFANREISGLITWLFPIAIVGSIVALLRSRWSWPIGREFLGLVIWGGWFATHWVVFSFARGIFHEYYTTILGPAVAAMAGIGAVALYEEGRRGGWRIAILPLTLLGTAAWHYKVISGFPAWSHWLTPVVLTGTGLGVAGLLASRVLDRNWPSIPWAGLSAGLASIALLAGPAAWSGSAVWNKGNSILPTAGPVLASGGQAGPPGMPFQEDPAGSKKLISFLKANQHDEPILIAAMGSMSVSPIIVESQIPASSLGGFMGGDPAVSKDRFAQMVESGQIRFFLSMPGPGGGGGPPGGPGGMPPGMPPPPGGMMGPPPGMMGNSEITTWVRENAEEVPQELWMVAEKEAPKTDEPPGPMAFFGRMRRMGKLYDCRPELGLVTPDSP